MVYPKAHVQSIILLLDFNLNFENFHITLIWPLLTLYKCLIARFNIYNWSRLPMYPNVNNIIVRFKLFVILASLIADRLGLAPLS